MPVLPVRPDEPFFGDFTELRMSHSVLVPLEKGVSAKKGSAREDGSAHNPTYSAKGCQTNTEIL
ncbi:hypothetical protein JEG40_11915, partial [Streptococcus agalactiae]|uniref:hypothetical protein n=1 Tax=Streptococcus agalactiae TaxID=1311 RepID=UPI00210ABF67